MRYFIKKKTVSASDKNSATGQASHTPVIPSSMERLSRAAASKTSVRIHDKSAETGPLLKAVNIAEANILYPLNR